MVAYANIYLSHSGRKGVNFMKIKVYMREKIYEEKNGRITFNRLTEYIGKEGVWALYGQTGDDEKPECLNVGKEKNVGREIITDLGFLHFIPFRDDGREPYINQFNEDCCFCYKREQVQEYLYPYISTQYSSFAFYYVNDKSDGKVEADYAQMHRARFWRNGHPYRVSGEIDVGRKDIQYMGDLFPNGGEFYAYEELLQKLKEKFGFDDSRAKRTITECEIQGFIFNAGEGVYTR